MRRTILAALFSLAVAPILAAAEGPEPAAAPPPSSSAASAPAPAVSLRSQLTFTGKRFPPPGFPEDQELLGSLMDAHAAMLNERAAAIRTTQRLGDARYEEKLVALAARRPQDADRIDALRRRFHAAWDEVFGIMKSRWPVDGRIGCRPDAIRFEVLMQARTSEADPRGLQIARAAAKGCLVAQLSKVRPLAAANRALAAVLPEVEAALAAGSEPSTANASTPASPRGD
jgi:hypothetical protein